MSVETNGAPAGGIPVPLYSLGYGTDECRRRSAPPVAQFSASTVPHSKRCRTPAWENAMSACPHTSRSVGRSHADVSQRSESAAMTPNANTISTIPDTRSNQGRARAKRLNTT